MGNQAEEAAFRAAGEDNPREVARILFDFLDDELQDFGTRVGKLHSLIEGELYLRGIG